MPCRRKEWLPASPSPWEEFLVTSIGGGADDDTDYGRAVVAVHLHVLDRGFPVQPTADESTFIWRKSTSEQKSQVGRKRRPARTLTEACWGRPWGPECVSLWSLRSLSPRPSSAHPVLDLPEQIWTVHQVLKADNWEGREIKHESYFILSF